MDRSELQIIKACQSGQMEQFVYLYDAYVERIYKFLYFRTFHQEFAEDLTSQVFLQAMSKLKSYKESRGTFQAWLYQIARNLLIDEYRKRKPTDNIEAHMNLASNINLENETQGKLSNEALYKLIKTLPEEAQELIAMRLWQELSYAEIAQATGKTEGSLKMQFSRIINKLQQHAHLLALSAILFYKLTLIK
jgi:RNA polymerase sigma-70 factor (ECF subfamily)